MSKSLKDDYETSKEYSKDIIMNISSILDNNNIQYTMNKKCTEIVIDSNKNESDIKEIITSNLDIDSTSFNILIEIINVDDKVYIRQKTK